MTTDIGVDLQGRIAICREAQRLLFGEARTPDTFICEPVPPQQVEAAYELMRLAPTSMNQQPLRMLQVRSDDAKKRLVGHMWERNRTRTSHAPLSVVLAADLHFHEKLSVLFPHVTDASNIFADRRIREESARFNAAIQIGYFILAARAAGLAVGPMLGFDKAAVDRDFFPAGRHASLIVVNLGQASSAARFPRLPRLTFAEFATTA